MRRSRVARINKPQATAHAPTVHSNTLEDNIPHTTAHRRRPPGCCALGTAHTRYLQSLAAPQIAIATSGTRIPHDQAQKGLHRAESAARCAAPSSPQALHHGGAIALGSAPSQIITGYACCDCGAGAAARSPLEKSSRRWTSAGSAVGGAALAGGAI